MRESTNLFYSLHIHYLSGISWTREEEFIFKGQNPSECRLSTPHPPPAAPSYQFCREFVYAFWSQPSRARLSITDKGCLRLFLSLLTTIGYILASSLWLAFPSKLL